MTKEKADAIEESLERMQATFGNGSIFTDENVRLVAEQVEACTPGEIRLGTSEYIKNTRGGFCVLADYIDTVQEVHKREYLKHREADEPFECPKCGGRGYFLRYFEHAVAPALCPCDCAVGLDRYPIPRKMDEKVHGMQKSEWFERLHGREVSCADWQRIMYEKRKANAPEAGHD